MSRNYTTEAQDLEGKKYFYDIEGYFLRYTLRTFEPFMPPAGKALELGCYKGHCTNLLLSYYKNLTVIEAAQDLITATKTVVGDKVTFIHSTFEKAAPAEKYDAIFLMHTLEHLDDPVGVLSRIKTWLSDSGRLFVVVPNGNAPSRQIAVKMGIISHNSAVTENEYKHGHRITYTLDTLERECTKAGLNIVHRGGVFFKPFANFQFDALLKSGIIDEAYLEGCYKLGMHYPDLCANIYMVCGKA